MANATVIQTLHSVSHLSYLNAHLIANIHIIYCCAAADYTEGSCMSRFLHVTNRTATSYIVTLPDKDD